MTKGSSSSSESDWFRKHEKAMIEAAAKEREQHLRQTMAKQEQEQLGKLRDAHWQKCPKCGHDMESLTMEGVELESCGFCAGIYFDRGELESLLLRKMPKRFEFYRRFFGLD